MKKMAYILQTIVLIAYALTARWVFYFERPNYFIFLLVLVAFICEPVLSRVFPQKKRSKFMVYSTILAGVSCSLLIDSVQLMPYVLAVVLSMGSKYIFLDHNRHYFNPTNFGVVLILLWFTGDVNLAQNVFASVIYMAVIFFCLGLVISLLAGQFMTSFFWIVSFCGLALFRSGFSWDSYMNEILIIFSSSFLLFSFNMITDPATTPKTIKGNFLFSFTIALFDLAFRMMFIPYGMFYSLFITSSLLPILKKRTVKSVVG